MKILELRLKNLNALYGEWVINFTHPDYVTNGIFALTGPTGAGKSTILDAICLALYGATPRLGKITKSSNEIMSRQTGECYAEVVFASQAGRFRCHWEQRRARKKPEGKLQDQEHQIIDADSGKPIETKKSLVLRVIEQKTGMDFDRFTRSILLAQGGFDTFLKADVEQKSKILEQITGTEIYSAISQRVHERWRAERDQLALLLAEIAGISLLDSEQVQAIQHSLAAQQSEADALNQQTIVTNTAIAWLNTLAGLQQEIHQLTAQATQLQDRITQFQPERARLDRSVQAATLDAGYAALTAIRQQQATDQSAWQTDSARLPALESAAQAQAATLKATEHHTEQAKAALLSAAPLLLQVRALDQQLETQSQTVADIQARCQHDAAKIDTLQQSKIAVQTQATAAAKQQAKADRYLQTHAADEWLLSGLAGVEEQLQQLDSIHNTLAQQQAEQKQCTNTLRAAKRQHAKCQKANRLHQDALKTATQQLQHTQKQLQTILGDRLLREYRAEKETLLRELAYLATIAELSDHRAQLQAGQPCPLCGAQQHPFATGDVPEPDATERRIAELTQRITQAEALETEIKDQTGVQTAARNQVIDSDKNLTQAGHVQQTAEQALQGLKTHLQSTQADLTLRQKAVIDTLQPLGYTLDVAKPQAILQKLYTQKKQWLAQVQRQAEYQKQLDDFASELKQIDAVIETQSLTLREQQAHREKVQQTQREVCQARQALYGDQQPEVEERRLQQAVTVAEQAEKKARAQQASHQQAWQTAQAQLITLQQRIDQRAETLQQAETGFVAALVPAGFADETQMLAAQLQPQQRATLAAQAKQLDDQQTELQARLQDRQAVLAAETAKHLTDQSLDVLTARYQANEAALHRLRDTMAGQQHQLREQAAAEQQIQAKQAGITAQKKECHRWDQLHELIGSADGKKYRNFAQGLTFELMVRHANQQLKKMTDRYLLLRDTEQPLALNVIDHYQAGEIRSTKNLSGGESFIVSLTLALGLSKMAGRKVRVDSLFLDEGFGTLDEEALETALEALSGLHQEGKLIGIISHVSALRDRISTQINITPASGGRSTLAGPGARALSA